ncbi:MAG: aldehyde dehydrogenase family protein [Erysipelothrix sp.]
MKITEKQKAYYQTGETRNISFRICQLKSLKETLKKYEKEMYHAFMIDLNKSESEAYLTELGMVYHEIDTAIRNTKKWSKKRRAKTPLFLFGTASKVYYEPVGTVLIIVPFNYPVQLAFIPLIGAIMAGNTAVVKLSELTPHVSTVIQKIITETFEESYVCAIEGEVDVVTQLLENPLT